MHKLSAKRRDRWPDTAIDFPKNRAAKEPVRS
jgi:hypothetical protein